MLPNFDFTKRVLSRTTLSCNKTVSYLLNEAEFARTTAVLYLLYCPNGMAVETYASQQIQDGWTFQFFVIVVYFLTYVSCCICWPTLFNNWVIPSRVNRYLLIISSSFRLSRGFRLSLNSRSLLNARLASWSAKSISAIINRERRATNVSVNSIAKTTHTLILS